MTPTAISDISELGVGLIFRQVFITDVQEIKSSTPQYVHAAKATDNPSALLRKMTDELMDAGKNHESSSWVFAGPFPFPGLPP